jgi:hypothetical protein
VTAEKCLKPVALGPEGIAVCIRDKGHRGHCDGGEMERRIGESFAAAQMDKEMEYDEARWK